MSKVLYGTINAQKVALF